MYRSKCRRITFLFLFLFFSLPPILLSPFRRCAAARILHTVLIAPPYLATLYIRFFFLRLEPGRSLRMHMPVHDQIPPL